MKILMINFSDIIGGAAKATYRLHRALRQVGVESWLLVQHKLSNDYSVIGPETKAQEINGRIRLIVDQLFITSYKNRKKVPFSLAILPSSDVIKKIEKLNPDIVHLHWIGGGMVCIEDLARINKPIIWNLHDMWAFTGGCHYDDFCGAYKKRCGQCKILQSKKYYDLSTWIWERKREAFSHIKSLTVVGLSKWIANAAKESALLRDRKNVTLPNLLDALVFKPLDKGIAREIFKLPQHKKIVLFGAINPLGDPRKGFKELKEALNKLTNYNVELAVFGTCKPQKIPNFKYKTHYLGIFYDDISLSILYSAVDVIVVPSLQENLSNTIMESLSCGTPVVAFNIGGNSDMIDHKINGYLANPFDIEDLAKGIEWILNLSDKEYKKISNNAREKVIKEFDSRVVIKKYMELYKNIFTDNILL